MPLNTSPSENLYCVYCGEPATTEDHVPPHNLFPSGTPGLIKVPACLACTNESSKDDEFFRNILANDDRVRKHPEAQKVVGAYERSLQRPQAQGLRTSILRAQMQFSLISPAEIIHGKGTALKTDFTRETKVLERITKGLFFHEFQRPHPTENTISVHSPAKHIKEGTGALERVLEMIGYINSENKKTSGKEIFSYGVAVAEDNPNGTFWALTFFKAIPFLVYSVPPEAK